MFYPDDVVENVRMHNNIVDVISGYVSLAKKGKYMFGLCPFHSEKTPSFSVDPERQMFYCYSCNKGGDVFKFVMDIENIDFSDSVKKLALTARIELPESTDRKAAERNRARARLIELNTIAARFFHDSLVSAKGTVGIEYLRNRKINSGTIKKFGLGYAPGGWDALYGFLKGKGFTDDELSKGGLALKNKNGDYYDRFRERVIFPIIDVTGNVIGFGGRVIDDSLPKYVNSPETLAFSKRKNLFGLNFAKKSKTKQIVLVEGYLDVITLHEHGIDNAVAALGTALTKSHGDLLKHYTNDIVIAFDTDAAGKAAAMKSIDILDRTGANITVLSIPEGKDPDEFINDRGAEGFRRLISSAKPVVEYKISAIRDQISDDSVNGRIKFLESVTTVLMEIDGEIEREMYVKDISRQYGVSEQAITSEIARRLERRNRSGGEGFGGGALTGALTGAVAGAGVGWRLGTGMRAGGGRDLGGNLRVSAGRGLGGNVRVGAGGNSGGGIRAGAGGNSDGGIRAGASGDLGGGKDADSSDGGRGGGLNAANSGGGQIGGLDSAYDSEGPYGDMNAAGGGDDLAGGLNSAYGDGGPDGGMDAVSIGSDADGFIDLDELFVVALLSVDNSLIGLAAEKMPVEKFGDSRVRTVAEYIYSRLGSGADVHPAEAVRLLSTADADIYSAILTRECHCDNNARALEQKLNDIEIKRIKRRMKELINLMEGSEITDEQRVELGTELREIMSALKDIGHRQIL